MKWTIIAAGVIAARVSGAQIDKRPQSREVLESVVRGLASDTMDGRFIGSAGYRNARTLIVKSLMQYRVQPLRGSFLHAIPIRRVWLDSSSAQWSMTPNAAGAHFGLDHAVFQIGGDFLPMPGSPAIPLPRAVRILDSPIVFGGKLGSHEKLDPKLAVGRTVVFAPPSRADGIPDYEVWRYFGELRPYRSAAAIVIASLDLTPPSLAHSIRSPSFELERDWEPATLDLPPVALVSRMAASISTRDALELMKPGVPVKFGAATLSFRTRTENVDASNIVAIVDGADTRLKSEYIVLTAPLDHLGTTRSWGSRNVDSVFNGADAATGAAMLVELARRLSGDSARPARSIVLVWTAGDAQGQLGSRWLVESGSIPRDKIVANINVDMIGRGGIDELQIAGSRLLSTQFGDWIDEVSKASNPTFRLDYAFDARGHPARYRCNGDHWTFARYGIPTAFVTAGTHADYNTVKDEVEKIDFTKLARVTDFIGALAIDLANRPSRPIIDKPKPDPKAPCVQ